VQGVGFRYSVSRIAHAHPVTGTVMNRSDGSVRLRAEGTEEDLRVFLEAIRNSPLGGYIRDYHEEWGTARGAFQGFEIGRGD
jgi:acylphosphatase